MAKSKGISKDAFLALAEKVSNSNSTNKIWAILFSEDGETVLRHNNWTTIEQAVYYAKQYGRNSWTYINGQDFQPA